MIKFASSNNANFLVDAATNLLKVTHGFSCCFYHDILSGGIFSYFYFVILCSKYECSLIDHERLNVAEFRDLIYFKLL